MVIYLSRETTSAKRIISAFSSFHHHFQPHLPPSLSFCHCHCALPHFFVTTAAAAASSSLVSAHRCLFFLPPGHHHFVSSLPFCCHPYYLLLLLSFSSVFFVQFTFFFFLFSVLLFDVEAAKLQVGFHYFCTLCLSVFSSSSSRRCLCHYAGFAMPTCA